jgi:hypothetical protein
MTLNSPRQRRLTPAIAQFLARELAHLSPQLDADDDPVRLVVTVSAADSETALAYAGRRTRDALHALELGDWQCEIVDAAAEHSRG